MDKNPKPKTTLKEIRRKMKKMTLAERNKVKEDKKEEKQKEKASKQKQKITQRVKININIPSQKTSSPQIQNPFSSSNRDQINLLTSINEQLKRKDEPKKAAENFNIPANQQSTQTEPTAPIFDIPKIIKPFRMKVAEQSDDGSYTPSSSNSLTDYGSFNTPNSLSFFPNQYSDSSLASSNENNSAYREQMEKIQKKVNEQVKNENIKKKDEALSNKKLDKLNQKQQDLINEEIKKISKKKKTNEDMKELADAIKKDELINQVKNIPVIDKPKDTNNLSLLEKIKEGSKESYYVPSQNEFSKDFNEVIREFENLYEPKPEDYIEIDKGQQEIEDELQGFSPKVTNPLTPPPDESGESLLEKVKRGRKPDTEEVKQRKAKEKDELAQMKAEEKRQKAIENPKETAKERKAREKEESERAIREQDYYQNLGYFSKKL
jgi:hypothetical protein